MTKIEFKFIVNKQANHYFFVQNLAMWHFSCRKEYNKLWLEQTGKMSVQEKAVLASFKKTRSKYNDSKSIFEKSFFLGKESFHDLKKELDEKDLKITERTMSLLKSRFEKIYGKDLELLKKWQSILEKDANNEKQNKDILRAVQTFYRVSLDEDKNIKTYLLINPTEKIAGGGANIDGRSITCEISHRPINYLNQVKGILWHETIHLLFDQNFFRPFLTDYFKKDMNKVFMYKELVASALFPSGVLGNTYFQQNLTKNLYNRFNVSEKQTTQIINLTSTYIKKSKGVDQMYIKKIEKILDNLS